MSETIGKPKTLFGAVTVAAALAATAPSLGGVHASSSSRSQPVSQTVNFRPVPDLALNNGVSQSAINTPGGRPVSEVIAAARRRDPTGFNERLDILKGSNEFTSFLRAYAGTPEAGGIEGLAAVLTTSQAHAFVKSLKGKALTVLRDSKDGPKVKLANASDTGAEPMNARTASYRRGSTGVGSLSADRANWNPPSCWQGWFAAAGYSAATSAMCGAIGAMSLGIVGAACGAAAWAGGMGINWNDACR